MMEIIEKLPDDIVLRIYTKYLKRFRFHKGQLIQLIDKNKYAFLEKYVGHRITHCRQMFYTENTNEQKFQIQYSIPNIIDIQNRKDMCIDDDMICIELTETETSLHVNVSKYRLKPCNHENPPSMYYRGELRQYDWDVVNYSYHHS